MTSVRTHEGDVRLPNVGPVADTEAVKRHA